MYTITIKFKNGAELILKKIDSGYLGEDNVWRLFNDLKDMAIVKKELPNSRVPNGVEFDGDTVFIPHDLIETMSFK